jgi:hypothetical protein
MTFSYVHPAVLDVYFQTLELNELGAVLDGYEKEEVPPPLHEKVRGAAVVFAAAEKKALHILGSRQVLNEQLIKLHARKGSS